MKPPVFIERRWSVREGKTLEVIVNLTLIVYPDCTLLKTDSRIYNLVHNSDHLTNSDARAKA